MDGVPPPSAELRCQVKDWTLASDVNLLKCLKQFSDKLVQRTVLLYDGINNLERDVVQSAVEVEHCVQKLNLISTKHFMENRVYDEDFTRHVPVEPESDPRKNGPSEFLPKIKEALSFSLNTIRLHLAQVSTADTTNLVSRNSENLPAPVTTKIQAYPSSPDIPLVSNGEHTEPAVEKATSSHNGDLSDEDQQLDGTEERDEASTAHFEPFSDLQKELAAKLRLSTAGPEKLSHGQPTQPAVNNHQDRPNVPASKPTVSKKALLFEDTDSDGDLFSPKSGERPPPVPEKLDDEEDGDLFGPAVLKPPLLPQKVAPPPKPAAAQKPTKSNNKTLADSESDDDIFSTPTVPNNEVLAENKPQVLTKATEKKAVVTGLFSDDSDEDLFAGIKPPMQRKTARSGNPPLPRDGIGSTEKDLKTSSKPAGAVSMFGSVNPARMLGSLKATKENGPQTENAKPNAAEAAAQRTTSNSSTVKKTQTWKPSALFNDDSDDDLFGGVVKKPVKAGLPAQPSVPGSQKDRPLLKEENNNQGETRSPILTSRKDEPEEDTFAGSSKIQGNRSSVGGSAPEPSKSSPTEDASVYGQTDTTEATKATRLSTTDTVTSCWPQLQLEVDDSDEDLFAAVPKPRVNKSHQASPASILRNDSPKDRDDKVQEKTKSVIPDQESEVVAARKKSSFGDEESDSDADLFGSAKIKQSSVPRSVPGPSQHSNRSLESQGTPQSEFQKGETQETQGTNTDLKASGEGRGAPAGLFDDDSDEDLFSGAMSASEKLQRAIKAKLASAKVPPIDWTNSAAIKDPELPAAASTPVASGADNNPPDKSPARLPQVPVPSRKDSGSPSNVPGIHVALATVEPALSTEVTMDKQDPLEGSSSFLAAGSVTPASGLVTPASGQEPTKDDLEKLLKPTRDDRSSVKNMTASLGSLLTSGGGRKPVGGVSMFGGMDPSKLLKTPRQQDVDEKNIPVEVVRSVETVGAPDEGLLSCVGRERPRIRSKRKPPSRSHRQSRNLSEEPLSSEQFNPKSGFLPPTSFPSATEEELKRRNEDFAGIPVLEVGSTEKGDPKETQDDRVADPVMETIKKSSNLFEESSDSDEDLFPTKMAVRLPGLTGKKDLTPVNPEPRDRQSGPVPVKSSVSAAGGKPVTLQQAEEPPAKAAIQVDKDQDLEPVKQTTSETFKLPEDSLESDVDLLDSGSAKIAKQDDGSIENHKTVDPASGFEKLKDRAPEVFERSVPANDPAAVLLVPDRPLVAGVSAVDSSKDHLDDPLSQSLTISTREAPEQSSEQNAVSASTENHGPVVTSANRSGYPAKPQPKTLSAKLFDESSESEDDLFTPAKNAGLVKKKNDPVTHGKPMEPAGKTSLFSNDSSSDDELFKPKPKTAPVKFTPTASARNALFDDDDDDDLFSSKAKGPATMKSA